MNSLTASGSLVRPVLPQVPAEAEAWAVWISRPRQGVPLTGHPRVVSRSYWPSPHRSSGRRAERHCPRSHRPHLHGPHAHWAERRQEWPVQGGEAGTAAPPAAVVHGAGVSWRVPRCQDPGVPVRSRSRATVCAACAAAVCRSGDRPCHRTGSAW